MNIYPNSIREQMLQAIMEILQPVAEQFGASQHRSPTVAITRNVTPALIVFPEEEVIAEQKNTLATRILTIRVAALVREVAGNVAEKVADQLITASHAALITDRNLGGLCQSIKEVGTEWDIEDADATAAAIYAKYQIEYRTKIDDLTVKG